MKKSLFVVVGCTCYFNNAISQENQVNLSLKPKLLFNKVDVSHDDFLDDAVHSKNQIGGSVEIGYQRITKFGFTYGGSIDFGYHAERINLYYPKLNLMRFDGEFSGMIFNEDINTGFAYFAVGPTVGYEFRMNSSSSFWVEFAAKKIIPLTSNKENVPVTALDNLNNETSAFAFYDRKFTNEGYSFIGPLLIEGAITYHFNSARGKRKYYVGIMSTLSSNSFSQPSGLERVQNGNFILKDFVIGPWGERYGSEGQENYYEVVRNKFVSIGLKIGVNLFTF
ncbi:MAG: hypothetical protein JNM21_10320 [Taibaiella sp.]|nr:hypothetical protein [Taibaiella sp.]